MSRLTKTMNKPTHSISAVTYKNGEADLTWEDLETGDHFGITISLTEGQCKQLAKVVPPCVYIEAVNYPEGHPPYSLMHTMRRCRHCNGTGGAGDDICPKCEGSGLLFWFKVDYPPGVETEESASRRQRRREIREFVQDAIRRGDAHMLTERILKGENDGPTENEQR